MDKQQNLGKSQREVSSGTVKSAEPSLIQFFKESPLGTQLKLLSVLFLGCGVIGTSSWIVFGLLRVQFAEPHTERELASVAPPLEKKAQSMEFTYELNQVSLGFSNQDRTRAGHAQFSIVLEMPSGESRQWMELHRAQLLDRIFEVGAAFTLEDFETPRGLEKLKISLRERLRADFGKNAPERVIFKDWVVQ